MKKQTKKSGVSERFLKMLGTDKQGLVNAVRSALSGAEDGELYLERNETEALSWSDGRVKSSSFSIDEGFGLRMVVGKQTGYVSSQRLSIPEILSAGKELGDVFTETREFAAAQKGRAQSLYSQRRPKEVPFEKKIALLSEIDKHVRSLEPMVVSVDASIVNQLREVCIVRPDGLFVSEFRPLVRLNVSVVVKDGDRSGSGASGFGGRYELSALLDPKNWRPHADHALIVAKDLVIAEDCPAGEMDVVLGSGWPGVILHEAFGHLTEGDFNFKGESVFSTMMGRHVAAAGVTVVDEGCIPDRRGSISFDDEGTPAKKTVLVKDGILVSYLHDRMSARQFGVPSTGNGRRESYACMPMPRMTNTYMESGPYTPEEIIKSVDKGIYINEMSGGQVDITSGKFVFAASIAWLIEGGKITVPLKGATLIGSGPKVFLHVDMVGNDSELDRGVGMCGKGGQNVPVGVGQPTIRIRKGGVVVGGTKV
jgi:TldD protein